MPFELQWSLEQKAKELIQRLFEPILPLRKTEAKAHGFNYPVDVFTKWRGHYFYFCATYRDDSADEHFDVYATRLEYAGGRKFNLAYMRHTGKWSEVFAALSLDECLETIESMELFWPVH